MGSKETINEYGQERINNYLILTYLTYAAMNNFWPSLVQVGSQTSVQLN